jgi:hypothetical protein
MKLDHTIYPRGAPFFGYTPSEIYEEADGSAIPCGTSPGDGEDGGTGRGYRPYNGDANTDGTGGNVFPRSEGPAGPESEGTCDGYGHCNAKPDPEDL